MNRTAKLDTFVVLLGTGRYIGLVTFNLHRVIKEYYFLYRLLSVIDTKKLR